MNARDSMSARHSFAAVAPLRRLLFLEICILAGVAGILAFRFPGMGLCLLGAVWLLDYPRSLHPAKSVALFACFLLAFGYAEYREPSPPDVPPWLQQAAFSTLDEQGETVRPKKVRVQAVVASCDRLPDNRARIILRDVVPLPDNASGEFSGADSLRGADNSTLSPNNSPLSLNSPALSPDSPALSSDGDHSSPKAALAPYSGNIVWSWRNPEFFPLPGETLEITLRLAKVRGLANPGVWSIDSYWHSKNVWFRAWTGKKANIRRVERSAGFWDQMRLASAQVRNTLIDAFFRVLPRVSEADESMGDDAPGASPNAPSGSSPNISSGATLPPGTEFPPGAALSQDAETTAIRPGASILPALLFADKSLLTDSLTDLFSRATLSHSLALSGLHLGFCALGAAGIAYCIGRVCPSFWARIPRTSCIVFLTVPLAAVYLWLGDAPLSLLRAGCMFFFWALLVFWRRPGILLDGLFAAVALLLIINPSSLFDIGLQLSALSVATIGFTLPSILAAGWRCFPRRTFLHAAGRGVLTLAGTSLCIQIVLFPLVTRTFGTAGLLFPLNLLWIPVLGTFVLPLAFAGLVAAACGWEALAGGFLYLAAIPGDVLIGLLTFLHSIDCLPAPVVPRLHWLSVAGFWLLCLAVPLCFYFWKRMDAPARRTYFLLILLGVGCLVAMPLNAVYENRVQGLSVRLVDVGQGQSVIVEWRGLGKEKASGRAIVDGGGSAGSTFDIGKAIVSPLLTDNAMPRLDVALLSHPDADHMGGLLYILQNFAFNRYISNGDTPGAALAEKERHILSRRGIVKETVLRGDVVALAEGLFFEVLWPERAGGGLPQGRKNKPESGNDASLVLRLVWEGRPLLLLCGDSGAPALQKILNEQGGNMQAQVLVLPHHGSKRSLVPGLYEAVSPSVAVAGCGYENRWGFPSGAVRKALKHLGIPLYHTGESGMIEFSWQHPEDKPNMTQTLQPE